MSWLAAREWENWCAIHARDSYGRAYFSDRFESEMDTRKSSEIT
ncbi:hypothetical protein QUA92_01255 [Microcoleus sp. F8-C1]